MSSTATHIKTEILLVPELRFKEFDEEWQKNYVNDLASKLKVGFVGTCEPYYTASEEGVLLVRTGNLKGVHIELDEEKYVTRDFHDKNKKSQIYPGDLLLARHGGNGEICRVPDGFPMANCLNIVILRTNSKLKSQYFQLVYSSFAVQKQISAVTAGSTQGVINTKEIGKLTVVHPTLPEQQKIASFLNAIDEKIQHLTKKKALLEQYKKGVMQQLFSGQLRFKDENENLYPDWEEKRLEQIADIKRGAGSQYISYVNKPEDGIRLVRITDFLGGESVYVKETNDIKRFTLEKDDILIAGTGATAGITFKIPDILIGLAFSYNAPRIRMSNGNAEFTIQYLKSPIILRQQNSLFTGNAQPFLDTKAIKNFKMNIPSSKEEQQKIATYLSSIDNKIESVTNQITQTQTFKKGLLQQMFVAA